MPQLTNPLLSSSSPSLEPLIRLVHGTLNESTMDETTPLLNNLESAKDDEGLSPSGHTARLRHHRQQAASFRVWQKLLAYCVVGVLFCVAFRLVFLPRTSLSRDLKRLHADKLTKADLKRIYLSSFDREGTRDHFQQRARKIADLGAPSENTFLAGKNDDLANYIIDQFKLFGYRKKDIAVDEYEVWLNYPNKTELSLVDTKSGKHIYVPNLSEPSLNGSQQQYSARNRAFHGYSPSGNATARFAFANYGTTEDFELITKEHGISLNGTIVIMKYGRILRGLKIKYAEQYGATGALLYNDAEVDHGFTAANGYKAYPDGPARNSNLFEKGSVEYFSDRPGDPTTPGFAVKPGGKSSRFSRSRRLSGDEEGLPIPRIPSFPISAKEVEPILSKLNGLQPHFSNWTGALEKFDYSVGPSNEQYQLNLTSVQDYKTVPIKNVIVKIPGILSGEGIILGNHRDSWSAEGGSFGDAHAGTNVMLEIARKYHKLLSLGWKPLRTVYFVSWDAEEYAMLGSTEYGEHNAKAISKDVLAYLDLDVAIAGSKFRVQSNPLFNSLLFKTAQQVSYDRDTSLFEYWKLVQQKSGNKYPDVSLLGGGNDYAVFQNHLAIPSVNVGFRNDGGVRDAIYHYHSKFDDLNYVENFIDKEYRHHEVLAKFMGLFLLNMNEREIIAYKAYDFAKTLSAHFDETLDDYGQTVGRWESEGHTIDNVLVKDIFKGKENKYYTHFLKVVNAINGSSMPSFKPKKLPSLPGKPNTVSFAQLLNFTLTQVSEFTSQSVLLDERLAMLQEHITKDYAWYSYYKKVVLLIKVKYHNYKLGQFDKRFLYEDGLSGGRSWMRYILVAPNRETGYDGQYLPGLNEALKGEDYRETVKWLIILSKSLNDASAVF